MARHAIISGGSIGGLFSAVALLRAGWTVDVYERTEVELSGRGAGIVTHSELIDALTAVGIDLTDLGVQVHERVAFDKSGKRVESLSYPQVVTSWDRIHQLLRAAIPDGHYHLGRVVERYIQNDDGVIAHFSDGGHASGDLLVGADGFRSAIRQQMLPNIKSQYSGYVVWRALANEADLSEHVRETVFSTFAFYAPSGSQVVGYPIAGPNNDLRVGHRRYNFVWYASAAGDDLKDMMTDETGKHHPISIPPPLVRDQVLENMRRQAEATLPSQFVDILNHSERPFFTPIYDHCSPNMHDGNVALTGDAACVARPHVGMGVTKAALDALCLAKHAGGSLDAYSKQRVMAAESAHQRAQKLGSWIFDHDQKNSDGSANPRIDDIMRMTAVMAA